MSPHLLIPMTLALALNANPNSVLDLSDKAHFRECIKNYKGDLRGLVLDGTDFSDQDLVHLNQLKLLQALDLSRTLVTSLPKSFLENGVALKSLSIRGTKIRELALDLNPSLHKLESLDLSFTEISDVSSLKKLDSLKRLLLEGLTINPESFQSISSLAELEELHLSNTNASDVWIDHISKLPKLRVLRLKDTSVGDPGIEKLASLNRLEELDISGTKVTEKAAPIYQRLVRLKFLDVGATSFGNRSAGFLQHLPLEVVNLSSTMVDDDGVRCVAKIKSLTSLTIGSKSTDKSLMYVSRSGQLKQLVIDQSKVTKFGIKSLTNADRLRVLDLRLPSSIDDDLLSAVIAIKQISVLNLGLTKTTATNLSRLSEMPSLQSLELYFEIPKLNSSLDVLARCEQLRRLTVLGELNEVGVKEISKVERLEVLCLYGCNFANVKMDSLHSLRCLRELQLCFCTGLHDSSLSVFEKMENLAVLNIGGTSFYSIDKVTELRQKRKDCRITFFSIKN